MKLVCFDDYRLGALRGDDVIEVTDLVAASADATVASAGPDLATLMISKWSALRPQVEDAVATRTPVGSIHGLRLRAPVPRPSKIMCLAASYRENTDYAPLPLSGFLVPPQAILDPGGTVQMPPVEFTACQHEAELVIVIGAVARKVAASEALAHVFGYTCGVDVSARVSFPNPVFPLTKSWDTFKPIGAMITTADEIADTQALQIQLHVNGGLRQDFNTSDMGHPVAEIVSWWSSFTTLVPGDLIFTGTNHQQLAALQDGDVVTMTIERVASLEFAVADELKRQWSDAPDVAAAKLVRERVRDGYVAAAPPPAEAG